MALVSALSLGSRAGEVLITERDQTEARDIARKLLGVFFEESAEQIAREVAIMIDDQIKQTGSFRRIRYPIVAVVDQAWIKQPHRSALLEQAVADKLVRTRIGLRSDIRRVAKNNRILLEMTFDSAKGFLLDITLYEPPVGIRRILQKLKDRHGH